MANQEEATVAGVTVQSMLQTSPSRMLPWPNSQLMTYLLFIEAEFERHGFGIKWQVQTLGPPLFTVRCYSNQPASPHNTIMVLALRICGDFMTS